MEFSSSGGMRSPFSPRVRQSITGRKPVGGISSRKNQGSYTESPESQNGEVIYKTSSATIETFGPPLPVMVTEMLTFGPGEVSARVSACGWAWCVSGRRAVCWPRTGPARCLPLPQTDLAHKADLLELFFEDGAQMPSCVSVSPEGVVRYWPSVGHEAASADGGCGLAGQEADRLRAAGRRLLLATTSGALLLLYPRHHQGRMAVASRVVRPPGGWLGGLGRRVSNLFFGAAPPAADTKLVNMVVLKEGALEANVPEEEEGEPEGCVVVVGSGGAGAGPVLTVWGPGPARVTDHCLRRALQDPRYGDLAACELTALDAAAAGPAGSTDSLLVLLSAAARDQPPRHLLVKVSVGEGSLRVCSVTGVRWAGAAPRCLPLPGAGAALLYCGTQLAVVAVGGGAAGAAEGEVLDLAAAGDRLLAAGAGGGPGPGPALLVLSRAHGLLALRPHRGPPTMCDSPMGSPCPSDLYEGNLSFYEIDPNEVVSWGGDAAGQLRLAVVHHARRDAAAACAVLAAAFPAPPSAPAGPAQAGPAQAGPAPAELDAPLDLAVRAVVAALLDDPPAGDPRWKCGSSAGGGSQIALGSSTGLQHGAQLADKQRALHLVRETVAAHQLAGRLRLVTARHCGPAEPVPTAWELAELAGRLGAARRLLRAAPAPLLAHAAGQTVHGAEGGAEGAAEAEGGWEEEPSVLAALASGALSAVDVCLRRVTRVPRLLRRVAASPVDAPSAAATATLLAEVLGEMAAARGEWAPGAPALGLRPLLPALLRLVRRTLRWANQPSPDPTLKWRAAEAARALASRALQDSPPPAAAFIRPFVEEGFTEHASALAEKFKEFPLLVEICLEHGDEEKLYGYMEKYADEGLPEVAFEAVFRRGGAPAAAMLRRGEPRIQRRLRRWLAGGPRRLRALHALCGAGRGAAAVAAGHLAQAAAATRRSAAAVTTIASLGKLCLLASDSAEFARDGEEGESEEEIRESLSRSLLLTDQIAALPRPLKLRHGLDTEDTRVLDPEELLQMYVEWEEVPSELELKKALDLVALLPPAARHRARLQVWAASIARDDWTNKEVGDPDAVVARTMFYRLLDLVMLMGDDVDVVVPPLSEVLREPRLAKLQLPQHSTAHFLLQYAAQALLGTPATPATP